MLATGVAMLMGTLVLTIPVGGTVGSGLAAADTTAPNCQGTTPLGLTGTWNCTFDDEFTGTTLNSAYWSAQLSSNSGLIAGNNGCYVNSPNTISVSGGYLNLTARKVTPFICHAAGYSFITSYESGMVSTYGKYDQTYGAFEVNAKLPATAVKGLQETFWLYPQTLTYGPWPNSGEIDFAEFYSYLNGYDIPYIHYSNSANDPNVTAYNCIFNQNSYNTFGVNWTPTSITVLYNGQVCLTDTPTTGSEPFNEPFMIALTQALGMGSSNGFQAGVTPLPATTSIDWVRAWEPTS
jgi:beta-glucanase (GH16 family)